jgi:hypothetical protein
MAKEHEIIFWNVFEVIRRLPAGQISGIVILQDIKPAAGRESSQQRRESHDSLLIFLHHTTRIG